MLRVRIDATKLKQRLRDARRRRPGARREVLRMTAGPLLNATIDAAPKDTRRYANGWIEAGNQASLISRPKLAIKESSFNDSAEMRLERQEKQARTWRDRAKEIWVRWQTIVLQRYEMKNRRGRWYQDAKNRLKLAERAFQNADKLWQRANEELQKFRSAGGTAIFIFGGKNRRLKITVRPKIYGGEGRMFESPSRTIVVLRNKEPHASIVNSRSKAMRGMTAALRQVGVLPVKRKFLKVLGLTRK